MNAKRPTHFVFTNDVSIHNTSEDKQAQIKSKPSNPQASLRMENPAPKKLGTYTPSGHLPRTSIIKAHAHDGYEEYGRTGYAKNNVKRKDNSRHHGDIIGQVARESVDWTRNAQQCARARVNIQFNMKMNAKVNKPRSLSKEAISLSKLFRISRFEWRCAGIQDTHQENACSRQDSGRYLTGLPQTTTSLEANNMKIRRTRGATLGPRESY